MFLLLFLIFPFLVYAQLPPEYILLINYMEKRDALIGYRILKDYPDAVFKDDLRLFLAQDELKAGKTQSASRLLMDINPRNLREDLRGEYVKLWKDLGLDPKVGFLRSPVLFREFIPKIQLSSEEALSAGEELFRRRYYREVVSLLEGMDFQRVCYMLGMSLRSLRENESAFEVFQRCEDDRARVELAIMQYERGQRAEVEVTLSSIRDRNLLSDALFRLGRLNLHRGSFQEAINYLVRMEPSYRRDFNLGLSYYAIGDYAKALENFINSTRNAQSRDEVSAGNFWAYKSALLLGREDAGEYLIKASNGAGFYHAVASSLLGLPVASRAMRVVMEDESFPKTAKVIKAIWEAGFPEYARLEALKRLRDISSSDIIALSRLDPHLAVKLAVRKYGYGSFVYNAVAFPKPYRGVVGKASEKYSIDVALIYAVMRQESLFDPYAVSVANARGLMQLIDSTAQYVARREGIKIRNIYDPETNILLGTAYLRYLLDRWNGDIVKAIASYNAGPARVSGWVQHEDQYLFIETIPLRETRDYVKRVLYNYYVYSEILK
ncbi:lytic transglycosylase domain-containing protein [Pampinifervens florentissimum]|uniref:lytic transglycosylase domain-containing protein n=1 Tax=Pampinifervens florentissimum TaxID=1632019 RepID=UPI0013B49A32|nr:lytic transglycosylase domain-containing protein [Hydrogenobacter sp. T-8]QID33747.1 lytic transglycosylase domain-containing protein [Hydrogenobacter sp. T-8]